MAVGPGRAERKRMVAEILIQHAGDLLEHWDEVPGTEDLDIIDARDWIGGWLKNLPGTSWDTRLDHPGPVECECGRTWPSASRMKEAGHGDMYCTETKEN